MEEILGDVQTSVTGLVGGLAGAASDMLGGYAVGKLKLNSSEGPVQAFAEFVVRATVSSTVFYGYSRLMPATSRNMFGTILFWYNDMQTIQAGARLGEFVIAELELKIAEREYDNAELKHSFQPTSKPKGK